MPTLLQLKNVCKQYPGGKKALINVNLEIASGEHVAIIGRSGHGKSTLLNVMATLDIPTSGEYYFDGRIVFGDTGARARHRDFWREGKNALMRRGMGFVFQTPFMLANFNVSRNLTLAHCIRDGRHPESVETTEMLNQLGLNGKELQLTETLSGGERQRVAIGRALLHKPKVVFADEPTGSLDIKTTADILDLLKTQCHNASSALVLVTHQPEIACQMDRCIGLKDGELKLDERAVSASRLSAFLRN